MLEKMKKVPAGTFLVPMLISAVLFTIFGDYFSIGGSTQWLLTNQGTPFIIAAIVFFSGTMINIHSLKAVMKRHGVLLLAKIIMAALVTWLVSTFFGPQGFWGISLLAIVLTVTSFNPSLYMSLSQSYGTVTDMSAFGLLSVFALPFFPVLIYGLIGSSASISWMPIISTLIPLFFGILLGNLDENFTKLFSPGIGLLLPILGWNIGYGMNLIEAFTSGASGFILAAIFYLSMIPVYLVDRYLLKNDGITALSMTAGAGLTLSYAPVLASTFPELEPFVSGATVQILLVVVISVILTPILTKRRYTSAYPADDKSSLEEKGLNIGENE